MSKDAATQVSRWLDRGHGVLELHFSADQSAAIPFHVGVFKELHDQQPEEWWTDVRVCLEDAMNQLKGDA